MRRIAIIAAAIALLAPTAALAAGAKGRQQIPIQVTPVLRVPFPFRSFVVDLPKAGHVTGKDVHVTENGVAVRGVTVSPLSASGVHAGVVLMVDSSLTMAGKPYANAITAAHAFISQRSKNEGVGVVTFNRAIRVLQPVTTSTRALNRSLAHPAHVAYGTHVFDAIDTSLALLRQAKVSTGAIVLLTDGQNIGSRETLSGAVAHARQQHVRIFTVGLLSRSYHRDTLQTLASKTGGSYVEATSSKVLSPIYASLSSRLANEYLLQYRSPMRANSNVVVRISISGRGSLTTSYVSPKQSGLAPYHEPFFTRFFLSTGSFLLLALLIAGLAVYVVRKLAAPTGTSMTARVAGFVEPSSSAKPARQRKLPARPTVPRRAKGALAGLDRTLEIADIRVSATALVALTIAGTVLAFIILVAISPVLFPLAFTVPLLPRAIVRGKLRRVRDQFAEQLSSNLQVLASALRAGHSFTAALASVVEQSSDPSQRELRRAVNDEQLGMPIDEAIRRVAERMQSRDLEQVALVAELQRTTGGNVAEVLDVVVATIRDRQDVRRMIRTLTAQGRMARWILTCLPIFTGLAFYAIQPHLAGPFYAATVGKVVLLFAALSVITGSLAIQKVIEIDV